MDNLTNDIVAIIFQHLNESGFHEAARTLEQKSGIFFNANYLEEKVMAGKWEEVEKYLLGFTNIDDNRYSGEMLFQIRKQKFLEDIQRENAMFLDYVDALTSRIRLVIALSKITEANPNFPQKLAFLLFSSGRLLSMLRQSLNMQHSLYENRCPLPAKETLSVTTSSTSAAVRFSTLRHRNVYASLGVDRGPFSFARATASTIGKNIASSLDDLPINVACNLYQGSAVMNMDFHPTRHTLLLVGSVNGEVTLWELGTEVKVLSKPFMIQNMESHSPTFQVL